MAPPRRSQRDAPETNDAATTAPEPVVTTYAVVKGITLGNGQTLGPGDTIAIADNDPEWPTRRPAQLVKQGYLRLQEG